MSLVRCSRRVRLTPALLHRAFASNIPNLEGKPKEKKAKNASKPETESKQLCLVPINTQLFTAKPVSLSSCPVNTVLTGMNYLKDQPPVLAMRDSEYPSWLWELLKPKVYPDDGPGGKGEKVRLRKINRQRIREQNFLKTQ